MGILYLYIRKTYSQFIILIYVEITHNQHHKQHKLKGVGHEQEERGDVAGAGLGASAGGYAD